jgi:hypothetical protein
MIKDLKEVIVQLIIYRAVLDLIFIKATQFVNLLRELEVKWTPIGNLKTVVEEISQHLDQQWI